MNNPTINNIVHESTQNTGNTKGLVYNYSLEGLGITDFAIFHRQQGLKSEFHFHKGHDKSFDPQILIMIQGQMKMEFIDQNKNEKRIVLSQGDVIQIPKLVLHNYECLSDVIFLEYRATKFDATKIDTFFEEDYRYLKDN